MSQTLSYRLAAAEVRAWAEVRALAHTGNCFFSVSRYLFLVAKPAASDQRSDKGAGVLYMVIETFRQGPRPVYARAAERGRLQPPGLVYLDSWIDDAVSTAAFS